VGRFESRVCLKSFIDNGHDFIHGRLFKRNN